MIATVFVGVFIALLLIGVPVAFAMGSTAVISAAVLWGVEGIPIDILAQRVAYGCNSFTHLAVPLFLLAGQLMNSGSITARIFSFANDIVGYLPGGLGHVNVVASMIFAGMSGTATGDTAGLGSMEIKAMTDAGFDKEFSVGITGASGLVSPIIPPSVPMVMYGVLSGVSVASLFIGGIVPGLLMGLSLCVMVYIIAIRRGYPREEKKTFRQMRASFVKAIPVLIAPFIIIGGIWLGVFTATEAAAVVVVYAIVLDTLLYKEITFAKFWRIIKKVIVDSASILFIIACVAVYGYVLTRTRIPILFAEAIFNVTTDPFLILLILNFFLLIAGCFMSTMESIILLTPIFVPLCTSAGIDLLLFGVIMCINLMIGQLTPPFGMVLLVLTKISKLPMDQVVKACLPFTVPIIIVLILCLIFPQIITFLPSLALR